MNVVTGLVFCMLLMSGCAAQEAALRQERVLGRCDVGCWMSNPAIKCHATKAEIEPDGKVGCSCAPNE